MFEDFESEGGNTAEDRKRRSASLVVSLVIFGGLSTAVAAGLAVRSTIVGREEHEAEVTFEEMPDVPEPPRAPTTPPPPRPNRPPPPVQRQTMEAPTEIPDEVPEQSDEALAETTDTGPIEGTTEGAEGGVEGGTGTVTAPVESAEDEATRLARIAQYTHTEITLPHQTGGCTRPEYPQEMRDRGVQDRIVVRVRIGEDGRIGDLEFVRGDRGFHDAVRRCVESTQWEPARLGDGTAVAHARTLSFPFRLSN